MGGPLSDECSLSALPLRRDISGYEWRDPIPDAEMAEYLALKPVQLSAVRHIRDQCRNVHNEACLPLEERVRALGYSKAELNEALGWIRESAPMIIHVDLSKVGGMLAADTHYRSQFETHTSGGTLSLTTRTAWENKLFGDAYSDAAAFDRCKYGVLNVTNDSRGVRRCSQYGSSCLVLRGVRLRTTLSSCDSATLNASQLATVDYYAHVLQRYSDTELRETLDVGTGRRAGGDSTVLTSYKEVQIHGEVRLRDHVALVKVDPSDPWLSCSQGRWMLENLVRSCNAPLMWMEPHEPGPTRPLRSAAEEDLRRATADLEILRADIGDFARGL